MDFPAMDPYPELKDISSGKFVSSVTYFITEEVVRNLWNEWNPDLTARSEDPVFIAAFQEMLSEAVSLGLRLNRFREISRKLPEPTESRRNWIQYFEDAFPESNIRVYLSKEDYHHWIESGTGNNPGEEDFKQKIDLMNDGLFYELGLVFRNIDFYVDESLEAPLFRVEWNDFRLPPEKGLSRDKVLVNETTDRLALLGIKGESAINPANGAECAIISVENSKIAEQAALTTWDSSAYLVLSLSSKLRQNAAAFVDRFFIDFLVSRLDQTFPEVVEQINKRYDKDFLVQVIRGLLSEEISVRNLLSIFSSLLSVQSTIQHIDLSKYIVFPVGGGMIFNDNNDWDDVTVSDYIEVVRNNLKRYISHKYTRGGNTMAVYLLDIDAEVRLGQSPELSADERKELLKSIHEEIDVSPTTSQTPIILTSMEVRRRLRIEICSEFPQVAVLSYQELSPDLNIQPIARISPDWEKPISSPVFAGPG